MAGASTSGDVTGFNAMPLPIALAHDNVVRAEDRHDVGDHVTAGHIVERAHMNEGRGANLQAVGLPSSVADDVEPQLALGGLGPAVDLPLRGLKTLGEQLELLDHAGQVIEDLVLGGQRHARHVGHDRPVGNLLQELLDHVPALPHLLDTYDRYWVRVEEMRQSRSYVSPFLPTGT